MRTKFSWDVVDVEWVRCLLQTAYESTPGGDPDSVAFAETMSSEQLAAEAKRVLSSPPAAKFFERRWCGGAFVEWLIDEATDEVVLELANRHGAPAGRSFRSPKSAGRFLQQKSLSKLFRGDVRRAFLRAHRIPGTPSGETENESIRSPFKLAGSNAAPFTPYIHQEETWEQLNQALLPAAVGTDPPRGLVVLPTGAGKTSTLTEWIAERLLADPAAPRIRILWLAHQRELLTQAAESLNQAVARLSERVALTGRIIVTGGDSVSTLGDSGTDVAFVSIRSLTRSFASKKRAQLDLFTSEPTLVVVDEAHHAGAEGYNEVLDHLADRGVVGIVGLTATPQPTSDAARAVFNENFPETFHSVDMATLIGRTILATPVVHRLETGMTIELDDDELRSFRQLRDLPQAVLNRFDRLVRNRLLLDHYLEHQDRYGATLVFASNRLHADHLGDLFSPHVPTRVLHGASNAPRDQTKEWFTATEGPRVLISVGMLTEGVDLPAATTALLARPTASRILMRQMIGRVLRGPRCGGAAEAHVIFPSDDWRNVRDLLSPMEVLPAGVVSSGDGREGERALPPLRDDQGEEIPVDLEAEVARFSASWNHHSETAKLAGYYALDDRNVPVFEHHREAYESFIDAISAGRKLTSLLQPFDDCPDPTPSEFMLDDLASYVRVHGHGPVFAPLDLSCTPASVANELMTHVASRDDLIQARFETSLNRAMYPTLEHFHAAIEGIERRRRSGGLDEATPAVTDPSLPPLPRGDRDLEARLAHVVSRVRDKLPMLAGGLENLPAIMWMTRPSNHVLGVYYEQRYGSGRGSGRIRINPIFNTTDKCVPDEMLDYLVYHELLHHLLPGRGHDQFFWKLEQKWCDSTRLDTAWDTLGERWDTSAERYRKSR